MRKYITLLLFALATTTFLTSCMEEGEPFRPGFSGSASEVYVVIEDNFWEGKAGKVIRDELMTPVAGLASNEPNLSLFNYDEKAFGNLLQQHRNIIVVNIAGVKENAESKINVKKSVWAKGQLVFEVRAATEEEFIKVFKDNSGKIIDKILREDLLREQKKFMGQKNEVVSNSIKEKHAIDISVPKGFEVAKEQDNFLWLRHNQQRYLQGGNQGYTGYHDVNENIFIYYYEYQDTNTFKPQWQIAMRDSLTKMYVPGPSEGSYMTTEKEVLPPTAVETEINGQYALQLNGLWKVEGDFMGGVFVSYTFYNEKLNRVITVEGNVFAPQFSKRDYIRELQAIISTLKYE